MRKIFAVIRREYLTRVRTRAFVIGTVLGPLFMVALVSAPILLERRETAPKRVAVVDASGTGFGALVSQALRRELRDTVKATGPRYQIDNIETDMAHLDAVRDSLVAITGLQGSGSSDGVLVIADSTVRTGDIEYLGDNVGSPNDMGSLNRSLRSVFISGRLREAGVDPAVLITALRPADLQTFRVSEGRLTGESGETSFLLAYAMSFLLYIALLLYGIQVMSSVVEEKSSRIVEVLISSLSPFQLLMGKVVGVGAVALTQLGIWAGTAMVLTTFRVQVAGLFGADASSVADLPIPSVSPDLLVVFLSFFALGFLFYAAAYAAIGSMCNSVQETQQSHIPITIFIAGGLMSMFALLSEPAGSLAQTLSLVPFFAPFVTPMRYSFGAIQPLGIALSVAAMALGTVAMVWVAARIYRVGILSYGKKAKWGDVARWVRAK